MGCISTTTLWVFFPQLSVSMYGFSFLVDMWQCFCYLKVRLCGQLIPGSYLEPWGWSHESFSFLLISMKNKKGGGESGNHSHVILWHNNVTAIIAQVVMHSHSHVTGWFRTLQYYYKKILCLRSWHGTNSNIKANTSANMYSCGSLWSEQCWVPWCVVMHSFSGCE